MRNQELGMRNFGRALPSPEFFCLSEASNLRSYFLFLISSLKKRPLSRTHFLVLCHRVILDAVIAALKVQMRAGGVTGGADITDQLSCRYRLSL